MNGPINYAAMIAPPNFGAALGEGLQLGGQLHDLTRRPQQERIADQLQQAQLTIAQTQAERAASQKADLAAYFAKPTADSYAALIGNHPELGDVLKEGHSAQSDALKTRNLTEATAQYGLISAGDIPGAIRRLEQRKAALTAAGETVDTTDAMLDLLKSGKPEDINRAQGLAGLVIGAAGGPTQFAEITNALNKGSEQFTLDQGQSRYDASGNLIASVAPKPEIRSLGEGDTLVGVDSSGGGSGARSTRLNNPGAIRYDPKNNWQGQVRNADGFVEFDTPENGARAHRKLIANQIEAGYDTPLKWAQHYAPKEDGNDPAAYAATIAKGLKIGVNDPIPKGAIGKMAAISAGVESGGTPAPSGGVRILAQGAPKKGYTQLTPAESSSLGLDPNVRYQRSPNGEVTAIGGQKNAQLKPLPVPVLQARASNKAALTNIDGALTLLDPKNTSREAKAARDAIGFGTGMLGDRFTQINNPGGTDARARIGQIGGIIIKDTSGAAVSISEDARLAKWVPLVTDSPGVAYAKLRNLKREIRQRDSAIDETFSETQGYRPFSSQPSAGGFRVLGVRPK